MVRSRLNNFFTRLFGRPLTSEHTPERRSRGRQTHVIILDGTMSSLEPGEETHAGLTYRLLQEVGGDLSLYYEAGVQWKNWKTTPDVMMGRGINRQIRRAYGYLSSRYQPGDRIILMGYSRGAYAVRSLSGVIGMVGLLKRDCATERNIRTAYRHYECTPDSPYAVEFAKAHCHRNVPIEMIGVWDTVKALGLRLPVFWRFAEARHAFHNHHLSPSVRNGFHALALDETRLVYEPVMWESVPEWSGRLEQMWFRGSHGDVGGQLNGFDAARPLANISLVWMLTRAEGCGLPLPDGWQDRFPMDAKAPSSGSWRGWAKLFVLRRKRIPLQDRSEQVHASVPLNAPARPWLGAGTIAQ